MPVWRYSEDDTILVDSDCESEDFPGESESDESSGGSPSVYARRALLVQCKPCVNLKIFLSWFHFLLFAIQAANCRGPLPKANSSSGLWRTVCPSHRQWAQRFFYVSWQYCKSVKCFEDFWSVADLFWADGWDWLASGLEKSLADLHGTINVMTDCRSLNSSWWICVGASNFIVRQWGRSPHVCPGNAAFSCGQSRMYQPCVPWLQHCHSFVKQSGVEICLVLTCVNVFAKVFLRQSCRTTGLHQGQLSIGEVWSWSQNLWMELTHHICLIWGFTPIFLAEMLPLTPNRWGCCGDMPDFLRLLPGEIHCRSLTSTSQAFRAKLFQGWGRRPTAWKTRRPFRFTRLRTRWRRSGQRRGAHLCSICSIFQVMELAEVCLLENVLGISPYLDQILVLLAIALPDYIIEHRIIDPRLVINNCWSWCTWTIRSNKIK